MSRCTQQINGKLNPAGNPLAEGLRGICVNENSSLPAGFCNGKQWLNSSHGRGFPVDTAPGLGKAEFEFESEAESEFEAEFELESSVQGWAHLRLVVVNDYY